MIEKVRTAATTPKSVTAPRERAPQSQGPAFTVRRRSARPVVPRQRKTARSADA